VQVRGFATTLRQSDRTESRVTRPAALLLVVAIHTAVLLIALHWVTRVDMRREQPLVFLVLHGHAQVTAPTASASTASAPLQPRKKPAEPRDTQLLTIPMPTQPSAVKPAAPIDWNAEAALAVEQQARLAMSSRPRALDKHGAGADLNGGLGPDREGKPEFGWDRSHTQRVESLEGGGILIHVNERCVVVLIPFPFPFCGIGKIPARGDLLDHIRDAQQVDGNSKNTAP
jgi:hypothetical protein